MIILRVWQECSKNLLWICFPSRPLVWASPNNSLTVEFGVRRGAGIAPSVIPPSSRGPMGRRWSSSRPPDRHPPPPRYPTKVRVSLSLPFCSLLCVHNSRAEEADSLVFQWPAQHRFYDRRGVQSLAYDETQGIAGQLLRRRKLQRVLRRIPGLPAVVTDVRPLPSDFHQVLAEHAMSREHLGQSVGEWETAAASPYLPVWEDRLRASMFVSLVDQLGSPLVPRVLLGDP